MNVPVCDNCGNIIHKKSYTFLVIPTNYKEYIESADSPQEYLKRYTEQRKKVKYSVREICTTCKELHDRIMKLRKQESDKLKKASDVALKKFFEI